MNLDKAFERRFLFKVKFDKPSIENKQKIWKSKIEHLRDEEAFSLAQQYNFSGGEIDNIVRKITMDEVLNETRISFEDIVDLCKGERFEKQTSKKIGFLQQAG